MAKVLTSLPDCAHTIAYQLIVAAIKSDTTMASVVKPQSWTTYLEDNGNVVRNVPIDNNGLPCVRMMPFNGGVGPEAQVIQNAGLGIAITLTTPGHDVRDVMNLWAALSRSVFTGDGVKALTDSIRAALKQAGETQGRNVGTLQTLRLGLSAIGPSTDSQGSKFMTAEGVIIAEMTVPK